MAGTNNVYPNLYTDAPPAAGTYTGAPVGATVISQPYSKAWFPGYDAKVSSLITKTIYHRCLFPF